MSRYVHDSPCMKLASCINPSKVQADKKRVSANVNRLFGQDCGPQEWKKNDYRENAEIKLNKCAG